MTINNSVLTAPVKMNLAELKTVNAPEATRSWCPVPHAHMIESVMDQVSKETQFEIAEEPEIGLSKDHAEMFFLLFLKSKHTDFCLSIGGRNAHNKKFPLAMFGGASIFICSNLQAFATYALKTKHTTNVLKRLPNLFSAGLKEIEIDAKVNEARIDHWKNFEIEDDAQIHDWLIQSMDKNVLLPTHLQTVLGDWRKPRHEEFEPRTMWSFNNCYTESFKKFNNPDHLNSRSINLTKIMDEWTLFDKDKVRANIAPETSSHHSDGYADNYNRRKQRGEINLSFVSEAKPTAELPAPIIDVTDADPVIPDEDGSLEVVSDQELQKIFDETRDQIAKPVKQTKPKAKAPKKKKGKALDEILTAMAEERKVKPKAKKKK